MIGVKGACKGGACKDPLCSQQKIEDGWNASHTSQPGPVVPVKQPVTPPTLCCRMCAWCPQLRREALLSPLTRRGGPRTPIFWSVPCELVSPPMTGKGPRQLPRTVQASGLGAFL